jgi:hypothetical protein
MRRIVLGVLGAILIVVGGSSAFAGAVLVGAFGSDGRVDSPSFRLTSSSTAFTSDVARLDADLPREVQLAQIHLQAASLSGKNVFIGVGPARQVLAYLAGSPYDVVSGVDGRTSTVDLRRVPGAGEPPAPTAQSFWVARVSGTGQQSLDWSLASGRYLFVIMNADGTAGVDVQARAGVSAPWVFGAGIAALVVGVLVVILGAVILALGLRAPRREAVAPVYATPPPPPIGYAATLVRETPAAAPGTPPESDTGQDHGSPPTPTPEIDVRALSPAVVDEAPQAPPREPGT